MKKIIAIFGLSVLFVSCSDDDPITDPTEPTPITYTSGSADFTKYVSVGNSLTAGYSDNALFIDGQTASYPNMLASNFALVGGGDFKIPFMADNLAGPFNNMGVPGAHSYHLIAPGYGNVQALPNANPYFIRMASSPNSTVLADAVSQNATFFSLWIGSNDILGYALVGGDAEDHNSTGNLDPATYGRNDITNTNTFASVYGGILAALTSNDADGVVANIPDVTAVPYFTTVPYNPVPLDAPTAGFLNSASAYGAYNGGLAQLNGLGLLSDEELAKRTINFSAGASNAVVIFDEDLTDLTIYNPALTNMRQATADDLIVLTARSFIGTLADPNNPSSVNGIGVPLADKWVLTPEEQLSVTNAVTEYNQVIATLAAQYNLAIVDANAYLNNVATTGVSLSDGSSVTATYATGGAFSLDGVHLSPRGYALVANLFIKSINTKYGSDLPGVNPLDYKGLYIN